MQLKPSLGPGVLLLVLLQLPACFPMVTHGPAVHQGGSAGFTLDLMAGTQLRSDGVERVPPVLLPAPQILLRQGGARGPFGAPAHVGLQVQPFAVLSAFGDSRIDLHRALLGSDLDLYAQVPGSGWDRGVGLLAGIDHASVYYEAGPPQRGTGTWYMAHQATFVDAGDRNILAVASTIARTESGFRGRAAHLGLTLALGAEVPDREFVRERAKPFVLVIGSMVLEFFGGPK